MKKIFLVFSLVASTCGIAQNKLTAITNISYDDMEQVQYIDSSFYSYANFEGSLSQLKPIFHFDGDVYNIYTPELFIHSSSKLNFGGMNYPLTLLYSTTNTQSNGLVTESTENGTFRTLYTYTSAGKIKTTVQQNLISNVWESIDSLSNTYTTAGDALTVARYSANAGSWTFEATDTFSYFPGTSRIQEKISYYLDGSTGNVVPSSKSVISYLGQQVDKIDLYQTDFSGSLVWELRIQYNFTGNNCSGVIGYPVVFNVVSSIPLIEIEFTYNASNQIENTLVSSDDEAFETEYMYNPDGFLKMEQENGIDETGSKQLISTTKYYYQSTASVSELKDESVQLYPVPSSSIVTVQSDAKIKNIYVYSLQGHLLLQQESSVLDISTLPTGAYLLKCLTEKGTFSGKLIKE